jgi:hypothetical protein
VIPNNTGVRFTIGEEEISTSLLLDDGSKAVLIPTSSYFIPTVQNFAVFLHFDKAVAAAYITRLYRVTLLGWLIREVQ